MKNRFSVYILFILLTFASSGLANSLLLQNQENQYVKLSQDLLKAIKNGNSTDNLQAKLKTLDLNDLATSLDSDNQTKAFWINIYNAHVQLLLTKNPSLFKDRNKFFKDDLVMIGGQKLSFDFIEHGIIRGSKVKLSMGFLKDPFAGKLEKQFRVEETDGRIHFALNCGAKSCPEIAIFSSTNLDEELDLIAEKFLKRTTTVKNNTAYVTTLFNWFRGDFSDRGGVTGYLKYYDVIDKDADPEIEYKEYDWTLDLGNYTTLN